MTGVASGAPPRRRPARLTARGRLLLALTGWAAFLVALAAAVALLWMIA